MSVAVFDAVLALGDRYIHVVFHLSKAPEAPYFVVRLLQAGVTCYWKRDGEMFYSFA